VLLFIHERVAHMVKRTAIKIDSELMEKIGNQITNKPWIKSKTQFASEAIEKEIKRLESEQNNSILNIIREHYIDRQVPYAGQGIKSFEEYITRVVLNKDVTNAIKNVEKKSNKKMEELEKKMKRYEVVIAIMRAEEIKKMKDVPEEVKEYYTIKETKARIEFDELLAEDPKFLESRGITKEEMMEQIKKLKAELKK